MTICGFEDTIVEDCRDFTAGSFIFIIDRDTGSVERIDCTPPL